MTEPRAPKSRRALFERVLGVGAAGLALPFVARHLTGADSLGLIGTAEAQVMGVPENDGNVVYIPAAKAQVLRMAEWADPKAVTGANRIAGTKAALEKVPAGASHYEARLFNFPNGSLRVLTFKKGGPVYHQITFETEIYVIQGSLTLTPLPGHPGLPMKVGVGDALFLPSGVLADPKPKEDTILLQAFVASTAKSPNSTIVRGHDVPAPLTVEWQENGKDMSASKPEELKKAPKNALRHTVKRYAFDGNSIRVVDHKKGPGRTSTFTNNRVDVLVYLAKGRMRRKEGDKTFEMVAGDAMREKKGNSGYWEVLEDSIFISTDAPLDPKNFAPTEIAG